MCRDGLSPSTGALPYDILRRILDRMVDSRAYAPPELWWRESPEQQSGNYGKFFGVRLCHSQMRIKEPNNK